MWLLEYGSSGHILQTEDFSQARLDVSECYSTFNQEVKYTLVRLKHRDRKSAMDGVLERFEGIVPKEVVGFASVNSTKKSRNALFETNGFKLLMNHKLENNPAFMCEISDGPKGGGILESYQRVVVKKIVGSKRRSGVSSELEPEKEVKRLKKLMEEQEVDLRLKRKKVLVQKEVLEVSKTRVVFHEEELRMSKNGEALSARSLKLVADQLKLAEQAVQINLASSTG